MSTYFFSTLTNNYQLYFDPEKDVLYFDLPTVSAASVVIQASPGNDSVTLEAAGKTITLNNYVAMNELSASNVAFADGSKLLLSNAFNQSIHSLTGGAGADQFIGSPADHAIVRASVALDGSQIVNPSGNFWGYRNESLSADGRYVAFWTTGVLSAGDFNNTYDVFLKDTLTGTLQLVSSNSYGGAGNGTSATPAVSADGRYVAFSSYSSDLTWGDSNGYVDIFVKDMISGSISLVSTDSNGAAANGNSSGWADGVDISANGRYVVFGSQATNLVTGDANAQTDVFVKDRWTGTTQRVSTASWGGRGNGRKHRRRHFRRWPLRRLHQQRHQPGLG